MAVAEKHGVYDVKHNDRDFDVENSEHIQPERKNVYWDCAHEVTALPVAPKRRQFTFTEVERAYYLSITQTMWMHR